MPRDLERAKEKFRFVELSAEKGSLDVYHTIEKAKSKRTEEMELA